MNSMTNKEWEQVVDEYRAIRVSDSKERNAKNSYLSKVKKGVEEFIKSSQAFDRKDVDCINFNILAEILKEAGITGQRNKMRDIHWMRILLSIVEEKTGKDMLSRVKFPPAGVDVDDPISRQEYIHEQRVNSNLDESQQRAKIAELADELWCSTGTIDGDLVAIRNFPDESSIVHIKMDINITQ